MRGTVFVTLTTYGTVTAAREQMTYKVVRSGLWGLRAQATSPASTGTLPYAGRMTYLLGAHVDQTDPIGQGVALEADVVQLFLGNPQKWAKPAVTSDGGAAELRARAEKTGIGVYIHAPYIINVASTNNRIRIPSRKLLQQTLDAAAEIGARGVIVHGGHVTADDEPEVGFDNWRKCIEGLNLSAPLLIENTAGGANAMARRMERLAGLWEAVRAADGGDEVGLCLDTCHAWAGGNPLTSVVDDVLAVTGRIDLVHCNNSRDTFGSGADRHAALATGQIAMEEIVEVVRRAQAPVILETPMAGIAQDLAVLRTQLAG